LILVEENFRDRLYKGHRVFLKELLVDSLGNLISCVLEAVFVENPWREKTKITDLKVGKRILLF